MKRSFFLRRSLFGQTLASFFALYGILFIPFPFYLTRVQSTVTDLIFGKLVGFVSAKVFGRPLPDNSVYSDSTSMYILVLLLFILSLITALLLPRIDKWTVYRPKLLDFIYKLCVYYLALQLLKYGVDKLFKNQFYLPEPNTLYTPVGRLDKDILYWSSMGTSHFYSVFMGVLETVAAAFLLFRKTRLIGLLMGLAVMVNVVAVNFGFDIGVKLFSLFLLFLDLYLLSPHARRLYQVLTQQAVTGNSAAPGVRRTFLLSFIKWFVIGLILLEVLYPFIRANNFNDDLAKRPYLHGAYEIKRMISHGDTVVSPEWKRLFIHRRGYMIFENKQDSMRDYKFDYNSKRDEYILHDRYQRTIRRVTLTYIERDSILLVRFHDITGGTTFETKAIDWRKLPALKKGFHWTTD